MSIYMLIIKKYFCAVNDYAGKADLSKAYWNPKTNWGNHTFFRGNQATTFLKSAQKYSNVWDFFF